MVYRHLCRVTSLRIRHGLLGLVIAGGGACSPPHQPAAPAPLPLPRSVPGLLRPSPGVPLDDNAGTGKAAKETADEAPSPEQQLHFEDVLPEAADPAALACSGASIVAGTALHAVNLCDLLSADRARKLSSDNPLRYELIAAWYADIRPTWTAANASLCAGEEAVLLVNKYADEVEPARQCVQLRCVSSFPPDPVHIGKNGEFCISQAATFERWTVAPGRVEAHYRHGTDVWRIVGVGEDYQFIKR